LNPGPCTFIARVFHQHAHLSDRHRVYHTAAKMTRYYCRRINVSLQFDYVCNCKNIKIM